MSDSRRTAAVAALVRDGIYPIDAHAVACAICARAAVRAWVPSSGSHTEDRKPRIRSFHASRNAPSFRLAGNRR
jgi:hypothetical protein